MDGAKSAADTLIMFLYETLGREASCVGRSTCVSKCGPRRKENPVSSSSIVPCESVPSKERGFLEDVYQARVSRS